MTQQQNPVPPPGVSPATTPAARPRRRGGLLLGVTLVVAVLGLVVGVAGVAVAAIALGRSDRAVSLAGSLHTAPPPAGVDPQRIDPTTNRAAPASGTSGTATGDPGGADPSATPTEISPSAQFTVAYQDQHLTVQSINCNPGYRSNVDLDEPRVGVSEDSSELAYGGCGPGELSTGLSFGQVEGRTATPADCLEKIRTDPARSPIAPTTGMTLCMVTSQDAAAKQGISQKLVFVTVDSISSDNGTGVLTLTAKAWNVPQ